MDPELVDRIYESAFVPELWPGVLADLAGIASARTGLLHVSNGAVHRASCSDAVVLETFRKMFETDWVWKTERVAAYYAARHAGFLREQDIWSPEEYEQRMVTDPLIRDILIPRGVGWFAGTIFDLPTGDRLCISLEKERARGPVESAAVAQLDALRPHLARSAFMTSRLQLERARVASETLAAVGLPALVLDDLGRVLAVNDLIEDVAGLVQWRARDRIALMDKTADRMLHEALATIDAKADVRSFPMRGSEGDLSMIAHVVPIRLTARDIFVRCAAALVLMPVGAGDAPPAELIQALFDLTPAEARVARSLATGKTVEDIASDGGVSLNTVRTQLRHVLEKTGCNRQAEAVALLGGISRLSFGAT